MTDCFLGDALGVLSCPFWSTILLCGEQYSNSTADTHPKLLDLLVSGASFLTGGVFECDLAHRLSMSGLCMLYKIGCDPMHPLYYALSVPYVHRPVCAGAGYTCFRRCGKLTFYYVGTIIL